MRKLIIIITFLLFGKIFAQGDFSREITYPKNYFRSPLNIPLSLAGTFGELRTNHFHSGLDIKTQQREGLPVFAVANGYISRIKISLWGYGKAIYITHPNGYTSVYAHLKRFSPTIEKFIKTKQYLKQQYAIQVFPKPEELPIKKSEIIAFSGSTGGFIAPHLHFEIRNTKTEKPINPMLFGFDFKDNIKPQINTLIGYSLSDSSHINRSNLPVKINFKKLKNGTLKANTVEAYGNIGFGINAFDRLNGATNKNGLYKLKLSLNSIPEFEFDAKTFSFSETKYINLFIDYSRFEKLKQRIQKCFIEPQNKLNMYTISKNGYLNIKNNKNYTVKIQAIDFNHNMQTLIIPIIGKKQPILISKKVEKTPYFVSYNQYAKFTKNGVTIAFPKNTFYKNAYLNFNVSDSIIQIHKPIIPLNKKFTLSIDVSSYSESEKKEMYIAYINSNGYTQYQKTIKKPDLFYTQTKKLGNYKLIKDSIPPTLKLKNIKNNQWLTHYKVIQLSLKDENSGIKSYEGEIDGKWILLEYNVKKKILTYNLNDLHFNTAKHTLKVWAFDNVGNKSQIQINFFRKK